MQFALLLFVGMIVHGLFAETLQRAPVIIISNVNYVKKIVFPLEILPVMALCSALFHATVSSGVLIAALFAINGSVAWTVVFLPIVLLPLIVLTMGISWALASLGVYLRDVAQPIGLAMTILLFASPVFYPLSALPQYLSPWLMLNPLSFIIEQARDVVVFGNTPNWTGIAIYFSISMIVCWSGYVWFQKTRKGFANVL
jgi:lipopolysaccharide transport system permease protein